ncbi:FCD domain-containing protein [Paracoccus ravus]|uniref:FCD domain-containing protein n=1 Tax=Paracoccus ravus TaxID=2447760 RepID=UPI00106E8AF8|nr:FCD domain-containing protein [Paracoccus ravus]
MDLGIGLAQRGLLNLANEAIYHPARDPFLKAETLRLRAMLQPYRRRQLWARGRLRRSLDAHRRIAEAIGSGDEASAGKEMPAHVLVQGTRFRDLAAILASGA